MGLQIRYLLAATFAFVSGISPLGVNANGATRWVKL